MDTPNIAPSANVPASYQAVQIHMSVVLRAVIDDATDEHFTLEWLMGHLPKNSFGVIMLVLSLITVLPVISVVSRLLLMILAGQIIIGYHAPVLPRRLLARKFPAYYLTRLDRHAIPALRKLEKIVRPRWPVVLVGIARPITAFIAILLIVVSLVAPVPLLNLLPAFVCSLLALAHIEHDGVLLVLALIVAVAMLAVVPLMIL